VSRTLNRKEPIVLHTPIACRSPEQICDDRIADAHTSIVSALNATCNGRCLYTGRAREALVALRGLCEAYILGEGVMPAMINERILWALRLPR
jgi:hypothetical protein